MDDAGDAGDDRGLTGLTILCAKPCDLDTYNDVDVTGDDTLPWGPA